MTDRNDRYAAMESADWLDRALLADGREHRADYIADDGFTARVAAKLPAPATLPQWRTPAIAVLWTAAAAGMLWALPGALGEAVLQVKHVLGTEPVSLANITTGMVALSVAAWAAAVVVLRRND